MGKVYVLNMKMKFEPDLYYYLVKLARKHDVSLEDLILTLLHKAVAREEGVEFFAQLEGKE